MARFLPMKKFPPGLPFQEEGRVPGGVYLLQKTEGRSQMIGPKFTGPSEVRDPVVSSGFYKVAAGTSSSPRRVIRHPHLGELLCQRTVCVPQIAL